MISKSDIQKATEIYDKAYEIATFISKKYIGKGATVSGVEIGENWIHVSGDEYWTYGGHDTFGLQYPSDLLLIQNDWQNEADKVVQGWIEKDTKKREQEEFKEQQDKEKQERKQYEKLKQKFESNDQRKS